MMIKRNLLSNTRFLLFGTFLLTLLSCSSGIAVFEGEFREISLEPEGIHLHLDSVSSGETLIYTWNTKYKNKNVLALFNSNLHSLDVYDLEQKSLMERIPFEVEGPYGLSRPEAVIADNDSWVIFSPEERAGLRIAATEPSNFEKVRIERPKRGQNSYTLMTSPEFGGIPVIHGERITAIIAPGLDFESKDYYKDVNLATFNLQNGALIAMFGEWPTSFQKDEYFGAMAEFSLHPSPKGYYQSFTTTAEIREWDHDGNKINEFFLASPSFPSRINGMKRYDNDLQEELNLTITSPFHLRIIYNAKTNQLFRLEKQEQELKDLNGNLNNTMLGPWRLVWVNIDQPSTIYYADLPYPALFMPFVFPYEDGIAIKLLIDRDEDSLSFAYYPTMLKEVP